MVTRLNLHYYLGINNYFAEKLEVKFSIIVYITTIME